MEQELREPILKFIPKKKKVISLAVPPCDVLSCSTKSCDVLDVALSLLRLCNSDILTIHGDVCTGFHNALVREHKLEKINVGTMNGDDEVC